MTVINNYTTWLALLQLVNVQQNGQIPPSVFNTWYNEVNKEVFRDLAEKFQTSQVMSDLLSPFIVPVNVLITVQRGQNWGLCRYPPGYQYLANMTMLRQDQEDQCFCNKELPIIDGDGKSRKYTDPDFAQLAVNFAGANVQERQVFVIDTSRWASCLNHHTKGPTWDNPKATQFKDGFKVAPKGITSVVLYYMKTPADSVFNYTISAQDILIYDAVTSTQLEWSDQVLPIFLAKLVIRYGLYINSGEIVKMGEEMLKIAMNS